MTPLENHSQPPLQVDTSQRPRTIHQWRCTKWWFTYPASLTTGTWSNPSLFRISSVSWIVTVGVTVKGALNCKALTCREDHLRTEIIRCSQYLNCTLKSTLHKTESTISPTINNSIATHNTVHNFIHMQF